MRRADILIIGGGVAGLSTALHLSRNGGAAVAVLEQEKKPGGHASGRNAGMLRQALSDPVLAELAVQSRGEFTRAAKSWKGLGLRANGSLLLARAADEAELQRIERTLRPLGLKPRRLSKGIASKKAPLLKDGRFDAALFCPGDAMVNIEALLSGFIQRLSERKVPVLFGRRLESIVKEADGFRVKAGGEEWLCGKVVNAAGAWAGWLAKAAGASSVPMLAYRRHLFFTKPGRDKREKWPFVWDVSHDFYFRPIGGRLMLSPCDKTPEAMGDRSEKIDPGMKERLYDKLRQFGGGLAALRVSEAKSGLRTMTPDGRFVVGEDPVLKGFYWMAGLGGHGVTTCFATGQLCADIVLGRKNQTGLAKALSPGRFALRKEPLHAA